ncbi:uncharacterized protein BO95DRAFT_159917 [Aspergillus brunneoviolaceus CBS 621.78]|uniref:Uncharacterized protein n=1 Tax=Aspergillus brunneoviolaceus CBS 621.78 TaxID=1450534 RepID=A0ACD1GNK6_9EURO|nr:hypothetical protein BO95DRAFT_159917 [Aspergillus brunneoviolaceus CBS 621.78]RAH50704.1 hypothetical protein BO95DRAFT_159917 [Aspergillus brunneoviolaceus CBS 621.78]
MHRQQRTDLLITRYYYHSAPKMLSRSTTTGNDESTPITELSSSRSSAAESMRITPDPVPPSTVLAMTGQYPPQTYRGLQDLNREIVALQDRLRQRDANQYLSFKHVSAADLHSLEESRDQLLGAVRLTYFPDIETLLIKVPTLHHEKAHRSFAEETVTALTNMGVRVMEREPTGAGRYTARSASRKEADSSYRNGLLRPTGTDWPHFVIESGLSESLFRLRQDVNWWIANSGGSVLLVLLLKVSRSDQTLTIEKYFPQRQPVTRARVAAGGSGFIPQRITKTVVKVGTTPPSVQGPPVVLEFNRVIGRQPVAPRERDVVFAHATLIELALMIFK